MRVYRLFGLAALLGCASVPSPTPQLSTSPVDPFQNQAFDCNGIDTGLLLPAVRACADAADTGSCLVQQAQRYRADVVACAVGDAEIAAVAQVRLGVADAVTANRAEALRLWISTENIVLSNKWCR